MLSFNQIKELIKTIDSTSVDELEIEYEGLHLVISKRNKTESIALAQSDYRTVPSTVPHVQLEQLSLLEMEQSVSQVAATAQVGSGAQTKADVTSDLFQIVSPMVGTFYHASSPEAPPFVKVGDQVNENTVVCIVEAMKLMNEIDADRKGEIVEILVENGQLVEYGQPLFLVKIK